MATVHDSSIVRKLDEAGLLPEGIQRVIIDMPCDDVIRIYYQTIANGLKLSEVFNDVRCVQELKDAVKIGVCQKCGQSMTDVTSIGDKLRMYSCSNPKCERYGLVVTHSIGGGEISAG
ncbi:MAG: hypothetical protein JW837_18265 [Sedimentisphaerales bacterium]|nr:hypothetical protein [Sedimentisphaerales bacterium]